MAPMDIELDEAKIDAKYISHVVADLPQRCLDMSGKDAHVEAKMETGTQRAKGSAASRRPSPTKLGAMITATTKATGVISHGCCTRTRVCCDSEERPNSSSGGRCQAQETRRGLSENHVRDREGSQNGDVADDIGQEMQHHPSRCARTRDACKETESHLRTFSVPHRPRRPSNRSTMGVAAGMHGLTV
jgi:hypothetical protein